MNTVDRLSRLRALADYAAHDLAEFEAERARISAAFDARCAELGLGENDRAPLDRMGDLVDDLADAEDEVDAARRRLTAARASLAQAEAEAKTRAWVKEASFGAPRRFRVGA